jgi:hypothetical protein
MISERRKLIFSMDELATAIMAYLFSTNQVSEKDRLGRITLEEGSSPSVKVEIHRGGGVEPGEIVLKAEALGALMIAQCIRKKIPMAKRARKAIVASDGKLSLVMSLD